VTSSGIAVAWSIRQPWTMPALWTGAALHDCGMLTGWTPRADVEDGVEIARDVIDTLCPSHVRPLAFFAVRNHDYVKDVLSGEVHVRFLVDQLAALVSSCGRSPPRRLA
jgi:hypothetical protein